MSMPMLGFHGSSEEDLDPAWPVLLALGSFTGVALRLWPRDTGVTEVLASHCSMLSNWLLCQES